MVLSPPKRAISRCTSSWLGRGGAHRHRCSGGIDAFADLEAELISGRDEYFAFTPAFPERALGASSPRQRLELGTAGIPPQHASLCYTSLEHDALQARPSTLSA